MYYYLFMIIFRFTCNILMSKAMCCALSLILIIPFSLRPSLTLTLSHPVRLPPYPSLFVLLTLCPPHALSLSHSVPLPPISLSLSLSDSLSQSVSLSINLYFSLQFKQEEWPLNSAFSHTSATMWYIFSPPPKCGTFIQ